MQIRAARIEDAPQACVVVRRSITELCLADYQDDPATLQKWLANKTPANLSLWIAKPDNHMFVATDGDAILGVACVTSCGEVTLNYVSPDVRFRGVSKALLQRLEAKAAELGNERCVLTVRERLACFIFRQGMRSKGYQRAAFSRTQAVGWQNGSAGHSPSLSIQRRSALGQTRPWNDVGPMSGLPLESGRVAEHPWTSQKCQSRPNAPQQKHRHLCAND